MDELANASQLAGVFESATAGAVERHFFRILVFQGSVRDSFHGQCLHDAASDGLSR